MTKYAHTLAWIAALSAAPVGWAEDWPTYQHDPARSGVTNERLQLPLKEAWTWRSRHAPQPAWPGPARDDLYNKARNLRPRMVFDRAFHVVAAGDAVYFGSSADDQVHCLDAATGRKRWSFFTEAPVRFAPTVVANRVFVGSDDGLMYCLVAADGKLVYRCQPPLADYRLSGNGRVMSLWAVRSGVIVKDDVAYFCHGLYPKEGVFVRAVRADDGRELWRTPIADRPAQGYMLASDTRLYVATGRENPLVFDRKTGKQLQALEGAGGTYALLTGDTLVFGPGRSGQLDLVEPGEKEKLATFAGNHMLFAGGTFFLQSGESLRAIDQARYVALARERRPLEKRQTEIIQRLDALGRDRASAEGVKLSAELAKVRVQIGLLDRQMQECVRWETKCSAPLSLILAGDVLLAGGDGTVTAYRVDDGKQSWTSKLDGGAFGLAAANGRLYVSTDLGVIHCFQSQP
jgi:outer membrane protein assembly factor BamB